MVQNKRLGLCICLFQPFYHMQIFLADHIPDIGYEMCIQASGFANGLAQIE